MSDRDSKKDQSPRQQGGDGKQMILGFQDFILGGFRYHCLELILGIHVNLFI